MRKSEREAVWSPLTVSEQEMPKREKNEEKKKQFWYKRERESE